MDQFSNEFKSEKRKPKNEIKFSIQLNDEQKEAKRLILDNDVIILKGQAGSGKSLVAVQTALDLLFKREIEKIVITRPLVTSGEDTGYLPGGIKEKTDPFTAPVYDNMYRCYSKDKIDKCVQDGLIEVIPLAFMRGRNMTNVIVIADECQNMTHKQTELLLGRLCKGSKIILCGDNAQIDLKDRKQSGFDFLCKHMTTIKGFVSFTLKTNHRHPIVEEILNVYKQFND
jgi:phosphate starvation-inducible PhoH-like protein